MYQKRQLIAVLPVPVVADGIGLTWNGGFLLPSLKGKDKGIIYGGNSLYGLFATVSPLRLEVGLGSFFTGGTVPKAGCSSAAAGFFVESYSAYAEIGLRTPVFSDDVKIGVVAGRDSYLDVGIEVDGGYYFGFELFWGQEEYLKLRYQSYIGDSDFAHQIIFGLGIEFN